jgi:hypothetical protein
MFLQDATVLYVGQKRIRDFLLLPEHTPKSRTILSPLNSNNAVFLINIYFYFLRLFKFYRLRLLMLILYGERFMTFHSKKVL